jgi:hypothetical protein
MAMQYTCEDARTEGRTAAHAKDVLTVLRAGIARRDRPELHVGLHQRALRESCRWRRRCTRSAPTASVRALLYPDAKRADGGKSVAQRSFEIGPCLVADQR